MQQQGQQQEADALSLPSVFTVNWRLHLELQKLWLTSSCLCDMQPCLLVHVQGPAKPR